MQLLQEDRREETQGNSQGNKGNSQGNKGSRQLGSSKGKRNGNSRDHSSSQANPRPEQPTHFHVDDPGREIDRS